MGFSTENLITKMTKEISSSFEEVINEVKTENARLKEKNEQIQHEFDILELECQDIESSLEWFAGENLELREKNKQQQLELARCWDMLPDRAMQELSNYSESEEEEEVKECWMKKAFENER